MDIKNYKIYHHTNKEIVNTITSVNNLEKLLRRNNIPVHNLIARIWEEKKMIILVPRVIRGGGGALHTDELMPIPKTTTFDRIFNTKKYQNAILTLHNNTAILKERIKVLTGTLTIEYK